MKLVIPFETIKSEEVKTLEDKYDVKIQEVLETKLSIVLNDLYSVTGTEENIKKFFANFLKSMSVTVDIFDKKYTRVIKDTLFVFWEKIAEENNLPWYSVYHETGKRQTIVFDKSCLM